MAKPQLSIVAQDGTLIPVAEADSELAMRLHEAEEDLALSERETRKLRRRIKVLEADKQSERERYAHRAEVEAIFAEWQETCGKHRSKLDGERFDAIRARLEEGYVHSQFSLAIQGAVFDPFVTEAKNGRQVKHNDIELICRTAKKLESFAVKAPRRGEPKGQERTTNGDDGEGDHQAV